MNMPENAPSSLASQLKLDAHWMPYTANRNFHRDPRLIVAAEGSWLTDDKGTDRAMLTSDGLFFANRDARPTITISSDPKTSELKLYGIDGKVSWSAP